MLTLLKDGLTVDLAAHQATGHFLFDALTDLPAKASAVAWVSAGGQAIGGDWYVDAVTVRVGVFQEATIVARQPGYDWTWAGLAPLEALGSYTLIPSVKPVAGVPMLGNWPVFSNWDDDDCWPLSGQDPIRASLKTWDIEFLDSVGHHDWLGHVNGPWPSGIVPPAGTAAGIYLCLRLQLETEPHWDPLTGVRSVYYRHFASFRQAPSLHGTQLEWRADTWD